MGSVSLDLGAGTATVAGVTVPVVSCPDGTLVVGSVRVRPLTFGERTRAALACSASPDPAAALAATIHAIATTPSPGQAREWRLVPEHQTPLTGLVAQVVALVLAGADEDGDEALDFAETVLLVARATGWSPEQLDAMTAVEVDAIACSLAPPEHDGWTRLRLAPDSVDQVRAGLSTGLLARARPRPVSPRVARALHPSVTAAGPSPFVPGPTSAGSAPDTVSDLAGAGPATQPAVAAPIADGTRPTAARPMGSPPARQAGVDGAGGEPPTPRPTAPSLTRSSAPSVEGGGHVGGPTGLDGPTGHPSAGRTDHATTAHRPDGPAEADPSGPVGLTGSTGHGSRPGAAGLAGPGGLTGSTGPAGSAGPAGRSGRFGRLGAAAAVGTVGRRGGSGGGAHEPAPVGATGVEAVPPGAVGPAGGTVRWSGRAGLSVVPGPSPRAAGGTPARPTADPAPATTPAARTRRHLAADDGPAPTAAAAPSPWPPHPPSPATTTAPARPAPLAAADPAVVTGSWSPFGAETPPPARDHGDGWDGQGWDGDVVAARAAASEVAVGLARLLQEEADLRGMAP